MRKLRSSITPRLSTSWERVAQLEVWWSAWHQAEQALAWTMPELPTRSPPPPPGAPASALTDDGLVRWLPSVTMAEIVAEMQEMQGDVDEMQAAPERWQRWHASEGGGGGAGGGSSPWAGLHVGVKSDDIKSDNDTSEGEEAGEAAGGAAGEGARGAAGPAPRGGPRLTALMPCKRELDATNPGAAFLREASFEVRPLHNYSSIFAAYSAGVGSLQPEDDDIVMLVHDDVAFDGSPLALRQSLERHLAHPGVGFVGAAGTRQLHPELVWWRGQDDMTTLAGMCHHGLQPSDPASFRSFFGPFGRVVVLDGVLLAATGRTLRTVRLEVPAGLGDVWHFYDVSYTLQAHVSGLANLALPLGLRHASRGQVSTPTPTPEPSPNLKPSPNPQQTGPAWEEARAALARRLWVLLPLSVPRNRPLPPPPPSPPAVAAAAAAVTRYAVL